MPIDPDEPKVKATKKEIEAIKQEIRELYSSCQKLNTRYQSRRLELGVKLLQLQEMLACHHKGTFINTTDELGIPKSTVYDLLAFAKAEKDRVLAELSENRTTDGDDTVADVDFTGPGLARFVKIAYPQGLPKRIPPKPKPYIKQVYFKFIYPQQTRLEVVEAWKVLKPHKAVLKGLSLVIAKEVINAATKIKKTSDK